MTGPFTTLRSHVEDVRAAVEAAHVAVNEKLRRRDEIHKKKVALQGLYSVLS